MMIGIAVGGMLTLFKAYPVYARLLPALEFFKSRGQNSAKIAEMDTGSAGTTRPVPQIKPPEQALTLSRFRRDGKIHTLAVLNDDGQTLSGVDISAALGKFEVNAFEVIRGMSFEAVVKTIRGTNKTTTIRYTDLLPAVAGSDHLAIGINYAEHGKETGQVKPFMFPKYVETDPAIHQVNYTEGGLLDHEVELGVVFPAPVCTLADLDRMMVGFLVVNDFTDRATLMRKMDSQT